jgi:ABC-type transport system substrate-binding protein
MASADRDERKRLYFQAQQILLDEAPQIIWYTGNKRTWLDA